MRAMVLAAGLGTRLRPLTDDVPKPALPVANVPLSAIALRRLAAVGATDIVVNAHHLPEALETALASRAPLGVHVEVVREPVLLGTGGGVRAALLAQSRRLGRPDDDEPILLVNGDVLFAPDLLYAVAHHRALGALATMVLRDDPRAEALGPIDVDAAGRVRRILRAPCATDAALRTCMFTGVHVLSGRAVSMLPEEGCIIRRGYSAWLGAGEVVGGVVEPGPFRDCGTPSELLLAMDDVLTGRIAVPGVVVPAGGSVVDAAARTTGATVVRSCVGADAFLAPAVRIERCLVLAAAHVQEDARDAILWSRRRLPA